jgi:NAD-dependent SIR2 family protein deacetylase
MRLLGAGISTAAGIPDFRSPSGLFATPKRAHSRTSGKDLFHVSALASRVLRPSFCQMIGELSGKSELAHPTEFHQLMHNLDTAGKLRRIYTQNIDCLEEKSGISFGLPNALSLRSLKRKSLSTVPSDIPRCIPVHGRIDTVHCLKCGGSFGASQHIDCLSRGRLPMCSDCVEREDLIELAGKRSRGIGHLRPSVVLYGESHPNNDVIWDIVEHDLDYVHDRFHCDDSTLLLVVGTSLQIPGIKAMVREFAKAVHAPRPASTIETPTADPGVDVAPTCIRSVYVNLEFPSSHREWDGIFDVWVSGDLQDFSRTMLSQLQLAVVPSLARNQPSTPTHAVTTSTACTAPYAQQHDARERQLHEVTPYV